MNKKAIAILGAIFLLIVGTLGFLVYQTKFKTKSSSSTAGNQKATSTPSGAENPFQTATTTTGTVPPAPSASSGISRLSDSQVVAPAYFYEGNGVSYFDPSGQLYKFDVVTKTENGRTVVSMERKRMVEMKTKAGFVRALWPNAVNDVILEFNTGGKLSWSYYSQQVGDYFEYPPQVESLDWMPDGKHIAYVWVENGKATLNLSDPNTKNWKLVGDMWETDDVIKVSPDGKYIAYYRTANFEATNPINLVSADGKNWTSPVKDGNNSGVLWNKDGSKFLFAKTDPSTQILQLWVYDMAAGTSRNLGVNTVVEKAVWAADGQTVYAGVPINGGVQPGVKTVDELVKINAGTGEKLEYRPDPNQSIDARDLFLGGNILYFRNAQDGYLYYLDTKKQ